MSEASAKTKLTLYYSAQSLNINADTKNRVFDYMEYVYTLNRGLKREDVLRELSDSLRSEVLVQGE